MKKRSWMALALVLTMLAACLTVLVLNTGAVEEGYFVYVEESRQLTALEGATADKQALVLDGATVSADEAGRGGKTLFFNGYVITNNRVRSYKVFFDGQEQPAAVAYSFNVLASASKGGDQYQGEETLKSATYNVTVKIPEGKYDSVVIKAVDSEKAEFEVIRLTNLTVTAPTKELHENYPVDAEPCFALDSAVLAQAGGLNALEITDNEYYATFAASEKGDPYGYYISSATKVGRFLLLKYRNNTEIPRAQFYIAQAAGITSDQNMIEFPIETYSEWTYAIIDLAENDFYDTNTQELVHLRFDPLEARNYFSDDYKFSGEETIDVAYIKGFTTEEGVRQYLEKNELHDVTKTISGKKIAEVVKDGEKATYTNARGETFTLTADGENYTYVARDVRIPCSSVPKLMLDGSKLYGKDPMNATMTRDKSTGSVTITATGADPYYTMIGEKTTIARYMFVRYRTDVKLEGGKPEKFQVFMSSTEAGPAEPSSFCEPMIGDGAWHNAIIDLAKADIATLNTETYEINFIRFDPLCNLSEGAVELECVAFFDSEDAAYQYTHTYKTYTVTFKANGQTVEVVTFEPGTKKINEPKVPELEGYVGAWESYTMEDKNFTVKAVYTPIAGEDTTAPDEETTKKDDTIGEVTGDGTTAEGTTAEENTASGTTTKAEESKSDSTTAGEETTDGKSEGGCGSVIGTGAAVLMALIGCGFIWKKKED